MKIKKPDFNEYQDMNHNLGPKDAFEKWFDTHVQPVNEMLEAGVEIDCVKYSNAGWTGAQTWQNTDPTHRALLINITEIKKETAEDVLRDFVYNLERAPKSSSVNEQQLFALQDRAKAVLDRSEE